MLHHYCCTIIARQDVNALWFISETRQKQMRAAPAGLEGIGPKDELEGMMAARLVATHNAGMECYYAL
jgi:hypothetical protein